jgi:hypothetical protein
MPKWFGIKNQARCSTLPLEAQYVEITNTITWLQNNAQ